MNKNKIYFKGWLFILVIALFLFFDILEPPVHAEPSEKSIFTNNVSLFYNPHYFSENLPSKGISLTGDVSQSFGADVNLVFLKAIAVDIKYNYNIFFIQRDEGGDLTRTDNALKLKLGCILPFNQNVVELKAGTFGALNIHNPISVQDTESYLDSGFQTIGIGKFLELGVKPLENIPWELNAELAYMPFVEVSKTTETGLPNLCQDIYFSIGTKYSIGIMFANVKFFNDLLMGGDLAQTRRGTDIKVGIYF